jgi:hypothetical protein
VILRGALAQTGEALPDLRELHLDVATPASLSSHRLVQLDLQLRMTELGALVTNTLPEARA